MRNDYASPKPRERGEKGITGDTGQYKNGKIHVGRKRVGMKAIKKKRTVVEMEAG